MRVFGRIEKLVLPLVIGSVVLFVVSTLVPSWQTVVAGVACPSWATDAFVVRYPHVVEPAEMVRNTPLVCVAGDRAELASHGRLVPALAVFGVVIGAIVVLLGVVARKVVSSLGSNEETAPIGFESPADRGPAPPPPGGGIDAVRWIFLLVSTPFVFLAAFMGYWWLAVDTPYRKTACRSSSGGSATCFDGEPIYRMLTFVFLALALAGLIVWIVGVVNRARHTKRFTRVWREGARTTATLVDANSTATKIGGQRVWKYTYEAAPDSGAPFRFTERGLGSPAGAVGGTVPIVYDPADTSIAYTVPLTRS